MFTSSTPAVAAGDAVSARGTVSEFFEPHADREHAAGRCHRARRSGNALPAPVTLTTAILDPAGRSTSSSDSRRMRMHAASLTSVAPTDDFGEIATVLTGVRAADARAGHRGLDPVPPDPTTGAARLLHPALRREPRADHDRQRRPGRRAPSVGHLERDARQRHRPARLHVRRLQGAARGAAGASAEHDRRAGAGAGSRTSSPSAASTSRTSPAATHAADEGGARHPPGDAVARTSSATSRSSTCRRCRRWPTRSTPTRSRPASRTRATRRVLDSARRHGGDAERRLPGEDVARADRLRDAGARGRDLHQPEQRAAETAARPAAARAARDGRSARREPAAGHRRRQPPALVHRHRAGRRRRRRASAPSARRRRSRSPRLLQDLQTRQPGTPVISVGDYNAYQFNDGYTDPIAILKGTPTPDDQIVVDASPDLVDPELRQPDGHAAGRPSATASSSRGRRRRSTMCWSTRWRRATCSATRSRAATPTSRTAAAFSQRRDAARTHLRPRHAGGVLPLPAADRRPRGQLTADAATADRRGTRRPTRST